MPTKISRDEPESSLQGARVPRQHAVSRRAFWSRSAHPFSGDFAKTCSCESRSSELVVARTKRISGFIRDTPTGLRKIPFVSQVNNRTSEVTRSHEIEALTGDRNRDEQYPINC